MTKTEIDAVLDRVKTWPAEKQEEAMRVLLEIEADAEVGGIYRLSPEELADIEEGMAEIVPRMFRRNHAIAAVNTTASESRQA